MTVTVEDYGSDAEVQWCPGCGNFGILTALRRALVELDLAPDRVLLVSGIGQAPKLVHYLRANAFNGLHGREIAAATAARLAAPDLKVLVVGGDGGIYGEGGNHFLHAVRRNVDLTVLVHDNHYYALTKGQASPTTPAGTDASIHPFGVVAEPVNALALAIVLGASFVGQGTSGRTDSLVAVLKKAIQHPGFALVNVLQPCVTWDKVFTFGRYQETTYDLPAEHDPADRDAALRLVLSPDPDRLPLGVIHTRSRASFEAAVLGENPSPLRDRPVDPSVAERFFGRFR